MSEEPENAKHWSGTFQRLRAETFIISILFVAVAVFDMKLDKFPVLGLSITPLSSSIALTFIGCLWLYFMSCWWVRFLSERGAIVAKPDNLAGLLQAISTISDRMSTLEIVPPPNSLEAKAFAGYVQEGLRTLGASLDRMIPTTAEAITEVRNKIGPHDDLRLKPPVEVYRIFSDITTAQSQFRLIHQSLEEASRKLEHYTDQIEQSAQRAIERVTVLGPDFRANLQAFRESSQTLIDQVEGLKTAIALDRMLLGFQIPMMFSWGCVAASLIYLGWKW